MHMHSHAERLSAIDPLHWLGRISRAMSPLPTAEIQNNQYQFVFGQYIATVLDYFPEVLYHQKGNNTEIPTGVRSIMN